MYCEDFQHRDRGNAKVGDCDYQNDSKPAEYGRTAPLLGLHAFAMLCSFFYLLSLNPLDGGEHLEESHDSIL
jgi:hypothetical protein